MMRVFLLLLVFLASHCTLGQIQLSKDASISIITLGPDKNELYAAFGHSAIRVADPANGIDWAYNYGVFDFDQPNFYLNFTRGFLLRSCCGNNRNDTFDFPAAHSTASNQTAFAFVHELGAGFAHE